MGSAAVVLMFVRGCLGNEASLLQVSQAPALQGQQQGAQVPQALQGQLVQSSAVPATTAAHNVNAYVAPAVPMAMVPVAVAPPARTSLPAQAALAATASAVKVTQAAQVNETALAFGQLSSLDTEFKELHADDASHVRQLIYNVHLREQLREKLREAREQLAEDNERLAERTMQIIAGGEASGEASPHSDDLPPQGGEASPANESFAALLLEAAVVSRRNRELNNAQIAAQALDRVKTLVDDIAALRARDEEEIQTLRANAQNRENLRKKIEERSDQLHQDTSMLLTDLGQIRDLVAKDEPPSNAAGGTSEPQATNPKQEGAQNEATPSA